ncbi:MAG TPA: STAS domain-containing protein [Candidatus Polarisedimenticolia bacterium]|nr:STAS domain-containing protein [Candidatus Polarisedimenticolia bacterium]
MAVSLRTRGDVSILELQGEFTLDQGGLARALDLRGQKLSNLGQALGRLLDQGSRKIVLDLAGMSFLDSAGIGELIAWKKRAVERGGDIRLLHPVGRVRDLLEMLSLTRILRVFDDEAAAVASFDRQEPGA